MTFDNTKLARRPVKRKGVGFLGRGRRPAILVSNVPGWEDRTFTRAFRQSTRDKRTVRRMRAAGKEVSA